VHTKVRKRLQKFILVKL